VNFYDDGAAVAFAALGEPFAHGGGEACGVHAEAGFERAVGGGEGVVKFSGAGEIPHAEGIEPIEGCGAPRASDHGVYFQFASVHG